MPPPPPELRRWNSVILISVRSRSGPCSVVRLPVHRHKDAETVLRNSGNPHAAICQPCHGRTARNTTVTIHPVSAAVALCEHMMQSPACLSGPSVWQDPLPPMAHRYAGVGCDSAGRWLAQPPPPPPGALWVDQSGSRPVMMDMEPPPLNAPDGCDAMNTSKLNIWSQEGSEHSARQSNAGASQQEQLQLMTAGRRCLGRAQRRCRAHPVRAPVSAC